MLDLRPHWWYFGRQILTGIPLLIVVILLLNLDGGWFKTGASWVVVALVVAWAVWLGLKYLSWARTYFVVTNQRVVYRTGVVVAEGRRDPARPHHEHQLHAAHLRADHRGREPRGAVGGGAGQHHVRLRASPRRRATGDLPPDGRARARAVDHRRHGGGRRGRARRSAAPPARRAPAPARVGAPSRSSSSRASATRAHHAGGVRGEEVGAARPDVGAVRRARRRARRARTAAPRTRAAPAGRPRALRAPPWPAGRRRGCAARARRRSRRSRRP